jgi:hypothetical protein
MRHTLFTISPAATAKAVLLCPGDITKRADVEKRDRRPYRRLRMPANDRPVRD